MRICNNCFIAGFASTAPHSTMQPYILYSTFKSNNLFLFYSNKKVAVNGIPKPYYSLALWWTS